MPDSVHQGILSVRWFAGVGSGDAAADTASIQAALDHPTSDAVLFNSNGGATTYTVTGLTISRSKRIIIDRGVTVRLADLSNTDVFSIEAADVTIEGEGTIDGNRDNQTSGHGIHVNGQAGAKIIGLNITECVEHGILGRGATRILVKDCRVTNTTSTGISIRAFGASSAMDDCKVVGNHVDRSDDAANNQKCIAITRDVDAPTITAPLVQGNYCKMHDTPTGSEVVAIEVFGSPDVAAGIVAARVEGNFVRGGGIGISIASRSEYCVVQDNTVDRAADIGIEVADSSYCSVVGNAVNCGGSTTTGIIVDGANFDSVGCAVSGNTVVGVEASGQGIYSISGTPYLSITGNSVVASAASARGIRINTSDDVRIVGNVLDGSTTAGTGISLTNSSRVDIGENTVRRWGDFAVQITANATTIADVAVRGSNRLQGTNGTVQVLEQAAGVANSITIEGFTLTLSQITADQNNYDPAFGQYPVWRISSDASRTITGIARGFANRRLTLLNIGSNEIILADESASSTAANRIDTGSGAAVSLLAGDCAELFYDGVSSRWRVVGTN